MRGAGDRECVDRIGLAALARPAPAAGHQLRRHAHDALAAREQEALELAGDVPAVLDRPDALLIERPRPGQHALVPGGRRLDRLAALQLAGLRADRRAGVALLVWIRPDHDHLHRPFD